ncbi:hypothetical protein DNTS_024108 [Danionella cerebrum]|uniref:TM2 domain-containing protein n=1 Tax=Danionella cerebrum TaxID=2873325 RepID=A0A553R986_9TELE|nr:hypothetical protein DNTS_024108 [Danionella translucida]
MASHLRSLLRFRSTTGLLIIFTFCLAVIQSLGDDVENCDKLRLGQYPFKKQIYRDVLMYLCKDPRIEDATQEPEHCKDREAWVECLPAPNVTCRLSNGTEFKFSGDEVGFNKTIPCRNVSGYSYKVAVALSLFLGWIGADRFYLGYPALGLLKFCTVGFCGIGSLVDFMLISMQRFRAKPAGPGVGSSRLQEAIMASLSIVGPSDGSDYIVDYYGARLTRLSITNETYRKMQQSP